MNLLFRLIAKSPLGLLGSRSTSLDIGGGGAGLEHRNALNSRSALKPALVGVAI